MNLTGAVRIFLIGIVSGMLWSKFGIFYGILNFWARVLLFSLAARIDGD